MQETRVLMIPWTFQNQIDFLNEEIFLLCELQYLIFPIVHNFSMCMIVAVLNSIYFVQ